MPTSEPDAPPVDAAPATPDAGIPTVLDAGTNVEDAPEDEATTDDTAGAADEATTDADTEDVDTPTRKMRQLPVPTWLAVVLVASVLLAGAAHFLNQQSQYYVLAPGPAISIPQRLAGAPTTNHQISYTTVQAQPISWLHYFWLKDVEHSTGIYPLTPGAVAPADTTQQMDQAKTTAAALSQYLLTGIDPYIPNGAQVDSVEHAGPASIAGVIPGDVINSVNGTPATTPSTVAALARSAPPGPLRLGLLRSGTSETVTLPPPATSTAHRLGVSISPSATLAAPASKLSINTQGVTGPSGGLMFTLAYLDAQSPGDLTGKRFIAGTGTISMDGSVGPIGGARYKVEGAQGAGAKVFFVPVANAADARTTVRPGMTIVPVSSVYDALTWLCSHGATDQVCSSLPTIHQRLATISSI